MKTIECLATVGMGEVFNPADAPDEAAWRAAMEDAPKGWNARFIPDETENLRDFERSLDKANE